MDWNSVRNRALQIVGIQANERILYAHVPKGFTEADWKSTTELREQALVYLSNDIDMLFQHAEKIGDPAVLASEVRIVRVDDTPVLVLIGHTLESQIKLARDFVRQPKQCVPENALLAAVASIGSKIEEQVAIGEELPIFFRLSELNLGLAEEAAKILFTRLSASTKIGVTLSPIFVDGSQVFDFIVHVG